MLKIILGINIGFVLGAVWCSICYDSEDYKISNNNKQ